jgi:hypothetical protein
VADPIPGALISLEEAKLSIWNTSAPPLGIDVDVTSYILAATPVIEGIVGPVLPREETRDYDGGRDAILLPWPVRNVTVTVDGAPFTPPRVSNVAGVVYGPFPRGGIVKVVATVGLTEIPAHVKLAARELVRSWWQVGRQGGRPAFGSAEADTPAPSDDFAIPRRVWQILRSSRTPGGFA